MKTSDEGRNYTVHFFICRYRHRPAMQDRHAGRLTRGQTAKHTVEKTRNRAGAPPLFRLSAAQKVRGGAPACPEPLGAVFFSRGQRTRIPSDTESDDLYAERRKQLPILKAPPKQPKNAMIQVRVEENIKLNLDKYARFIGGNQAYVV